MKPELFPKHSVFLEPFFYADNVEYFIPFVEGQTWLGSSLSACYRAEIAEDQDFLLGIYLNMMYSALMPLCSSSRVCRRVSRIKSSSDGFFFLG